MKKIGLPLNVINKGGIYMKVVMILIDGMRPDAFMLSPLSNKLLNMSSYSLNAKTVMPSMTLPCHMSLFLSVDPFRHGIITNQYVPQVRPVKGLVEVLTQNEKSCAFFYNWEELRELVRPANLAYSFYASGEKLGYDKANAMVVEDAIRRISQFQFDFSFVYLGESDEEGHRYGWMSEKYNESVLRSVEDVYRIMNALGEEYTYILLADHGGHERIHGHDIDEDMTIPVLIQGPGIKKNYVLENVSIKDIAPTIVSLMGLKKDKDWEGKALNECH